jgi:hypothetical protein
MLAVYLSVPEAENTRRALNTANGMRRARQMSRYPKQFGPQDFIGIKKGNNMICCFLKLTGAGSNN